MRRPGAILQALPKCANAWKRAARMRNAYLETWPDAPLLDVCRDVSERFSARFGEMNAPAAFLFGLSHEVGHYDADRRGQASGAGRAPSGQHETQTPVERRGVHAIAVQDSLNPEG